MQKISSDTQNKSGNTGEIMQYYNNFLRNNGISDIERVVCLNRVLTICTEKANALFSCKVEFICPAELIYVQENSRNVLEEYCTLLDKYCTLYSEITVKLERNNSGNTATLIIYDSNNNELRRLDIELYTGIPGLVIRTPEKDSLMEKTIVEIFAKLEYIKSHN